MTRDIELMASDPTVFAICEKCNRKGRGVHLGDISCKAFTKREWRQNPVCDNCNTPMTRLYEVKNAD
jgi:hypothetical protein